MIIILTQSDPRTTRSQGPRTSSAFVLYKDLPLQYISTSKYVCLRSSRLFLLTDLIIYKLRLLLIPSETTTANRQSTHIVILDACFLTYIAPPLTNPRARPRRHLSLYVAAAQSHGHELVLPPAIDPAAGVWLRR